MNISEKLRLLMDRKTADARDNLDFSGNTLMMIPRLSLDDLWTSAPASERTVDSAKVRGRPEGARHYLERAIAAGTPLASAVRLHLHGEIRLRGWCPFSAEQVIRWDDLARHGTDAWHLDSGRR